MPKAWLRTIETKQAWLMIIEQREGMAQDRRNFGRHGLLSWRPEACLRIVETGGF
jgi:hypothetical protein